MTRIVYAGNSDFALGPLQALIDSDMGVELVISQKDKKRSRGKLSPSPVKAYALEEGIEVYTTDNINDKEALETLSRIDPDLIVVVSFGQIIGQDLLEKYKDRILNVHASILPKFRGASPIQAVLAKGEKRTGVSIMLIDKGIDTGDVLKVCEMHIGDDHNSLSLSEDLSRLGGTCLVETLKDFEAYYANRTKQDESESSYSGLISKDMGRINYNDPGEEILNKFRAFYAWPKLYTSYKGDNIKIHGMYLANRVEGYENGQIIRANEEGIFVNCMDKCLVFTQVQFPNKKNMEVGQYLKGNSIDLVKLT